MKRVWEYVVTVSKLWGKAISGPVLAVIGVALLVSQQFVTDQQTAADLLKVSGFLTLAAAFFLGLAAQYTAWKNEREARFAAERELNADADIRGTIWILLPSGTVSAGLCILRYGWNTANHGRKECEISRAMIEIQPRGQKGFNFLDHLPVQSVRRVAPGGEFRYEGTVQIPNLTCAELRESEITIVPIDSLGVQYRNTVTEKPVVSTNSGLQPARPA